MKGKLELTWVGKEVQPKLEPRILLEDPEKSYHADRRVSENDIFDNWLIFGDNLLALKALEQELAGQVKCIFIDPPYNTGAAFEQYDDGLEHSIWLSLMRDRLAILANLLSSDGSIWITLDDNEVHYFKVMADEVIGRGSFVASIAWEKDKGRRNDTDISAAHDYVLLYAKNRSVWKNTRNLLGREEHQDARYRNPDKDPRGPWLQGDNSTTKSGTDRNRFEVVLPSGRVVTPPAGRYWGFSPDTLESAKREGRVWFGRTGDSLPVIKRYASEVQQGVVPRTFWTADEAGHNQEAKRDHLNKLLTDVAPFETPKPERLLQRIITIASNPGDLVLDSFAGSGTAGAAAQKMGRRWIMVELGEHCHTHIIPRLRKVIDGDDPGGITKAVDWKGGGGFRYYRLAPSLIATDKYGNEVINPEFNREMLAEAVCKLEGFTYSPSVEVYWQHGRSTGTDFIFITTQTLTHEQLAAISEEVGDERTLLICCAAFRGNPDVFPNLTVKKIPKAVLHKCQWDWNEYEERVKKLGYKAEQLGGLFAEADAEEAE